MATRVSVIDMVVGQTYANVYILKQHAIKQTKQGTNYIDLVLQDKTGEMPGKLWTIPPSLNLDNLQDSDYIVLQFSVEDYQGNKQAKILNIREVKETDKFDKNDLIPVAPEPVEKMYDELMNTAQGFNSTPLKKVVTTALKENKEVLLTMPGAKSVHHAVLGGLLLHTCGMLRTAKAIASVYPTVRKEVLYAGVIIHDIAKIKEFQTGPIGLVTDYSTSGKLLGHIHMGAKYIGDLCEKLDIDPEISTILQHMILSHHGIPEHGSAVTPMFLEAELLHLCDRIDSRVYMYNEAIKDTPVGEFSSKVFALDNKQIYNFKWDENDGLNTDLDDDGLYKILGENKMILNFSNKEVMINSNSIFLAGPTMRNSSYEKSWRKEAVSILSDFGYSGIVYIPEYPPDIPFSDKYIVKQTKWEWKALDNAGVIIFWVPRTLPDMPAFTTNIEFGRYLTKKPNQVILGYPDNACKMEYMKLLYQEITEEAPEKTLKTTLQKAINYLNNK